MTDIIKRYRVDCNNALDIGGGTGLLSLMLAQECDIAIDAIEINEEAFIQACENTGASPWHNRIRVIHSDVQHFEAPVKYDFIFSNPPFFENDLISLDLKKNQAKHNASLTLEVLLDCISKNLSSKGFAAVLLPSHRTIEFEEMLEKQSFFVVEKMMVRQSITHSYFRTMLFFTNSKFTDTATVNDISIHDKDRSYTLEFVSLMKDYYLKL